MPSAHLVQLAIAWEDPPANHERVAALLDRAPVRPGDLVLLPEMFATGFSFHIEATNDKQGTTLQCLLELADDLEITIMGGRTVAACHRCVARNVMSVCAPGQRLLCEYAKQRLFSPGGEHERFEAGRETVTFSWDAAGMCVQPAICYDLRFPEVFRAGLRAGSQCIALGACWPDVRQHHWRALAIARAIENQCFVLACNRVGDDPPRVAMGEGTRPGLHYAGGSLVVSPKGEVLGELDDREGVLSVPIDAGQMHAWRAQFPAWREA